MAAVRIADSLSSEASSEAWILPANTERKLKNHIQTLAALKAPGTQSFALRSVIFLFSEQAFSTQRCRVLKGSQSFAELSALRDFAFKFWLRPGGEELRAFAFKPPRTDYFVEPSATKPRQAQIGRIQRSPRFFIRRLHCIRCP